MKPHDLRHGVAMEILEAQHDLEAMRAMLGHVRLETTQIYAQLAYWLPFVDTYRTLCLAPPPALRQVFDDARLIA